jgi:hypothetical protein
MAERGKVNEFFSVEEFIKQQKIVTDGLRDYLDTVNKIQPIRVELQGADKLKDVVDGVSKINEAQKKAAESAAAVSDGLSAYNGQLAKLSTNVQANIKQQVDYKTRLSEISAELKKLKKEQEIVNKVPGNDDAKKQIQDRILLLSEEQAQVKQLNSELTRLTNTQIREQQSSEGTLKQLRAELDNLRNFRDINLKVGTADFDQATVKIKALNDAISEQEQKGGDFRRNVGNYQGSAKIITEAFERARMKVKEFSTQLGPASPEARAARIEFEALERVTSNPQFLNIAAKVGDTNKELRFFTQRLNELEDAGLKNSQVYADVRARLAQLTDQIGDTKAEIKALSSDTRSFDLFAGSVNFAADALQTYAGIAALAGANEEDVAKSIQTVVAIQSVANGVKGIANELTTKGTAANKAYAFVQKQVEILTSASTSATQKWGAALKSIGIGLLVAAVVKLVDALDLFGDSSKDAEKATEDLNKALENQKELLDSLSTGYKNNEKLSNLRLKANGATDKQLYENSKKFRESELADIKSQVDQETALRVKAQEDFNKRAAIADQVRKQLGKNAKVTFPDGKTLEESLAELNKRNKLEVELKKAYQDKERELNEFNAEEDVRIAEEAADAKKKAADKARQESEKSVQEQLRIAEANRVAEFELQKLDIQRRIDFNNQILENDKSTWDERLTAQRLAYEAQTELIELNYKFQISEAGKTEKEIQLAMAQAGDAKLRLDREFAEKRKDIYKSIKDGLTGEEQDLQDKLKAVIQKGYDDFKAREDAKVKQAKEIADKLVEVEKEKNEKLRDLRKELFGEIQESVLAFLNWNEEKELGELKDKMERIDREKAADIENVNQTIANRAIAADEVALIEARAQNQKEALEARQRELEVRKANTERVVQIAKITGDTVSTIFQLNSRSAEATANAYKMLSDPLTAPYAPVSFAAAASIKTQIPFVIGLGAAQIARLVIPKYAEGTDNHPADGPAIVGDGGKRELVITPTGKAYMTDNKPQMVFLEKGSKVIADADKAIAATMHAGYEQRAATLTSIPAFTDAKLTNEVKGMRKDIVRAIEKIPQPIIHTTGPVSRRIRRGDSSNTYLNNNLQA